MQSSDITGQVFGRLLLVEKTRLASGRIGWFCRCECGGEVIASRSNLVGRQVLSCGCLHKERARQAKSTHGKSKTRTYRIWRNMINRCHWDKWPEWHLYGGRGIFVCQEWRDSFEAFVADMGEAPKDRSIDRFPDGDGPYIRGNCRWATPKEQANNRRKPSKTYNDEKL